MKKLLYILLSLASFATNAATSITTPTVSGHWTLAGSPFKIYNDITITTGQSLVIDPGVSVVFQGAYKIISDGVLKAVGTSALPIVFDVQDTTGWYIDTFNCHTGGWQGVYIGLSVTPDSSAISYCDFHHIKNGVISVGRSLHISNCNFTSNFGRAVELTSGPTSTGVYELDNCNFNNNTATWGALIKVSADPGIAWYVHDNNINNNYVGQYGNLMFCGSSPLLFSRNNVHHNSTAPNTTLIYVYASGIDPAEIVFSRNKIYENVTDRAAAVYCYYAKTDFYGNYICNNQHTSGDCGYLDGGGALFLYGDGDYGRSAYTVRNNIMANNYSPYVGGAIYINNARTLIANNAIVNNKAPEGGGMKILAVDTVTICLKNNIIAGNQNTNSAYYGNVRLTVMGHMNLKYDHNWTTRAFDSNMCIYSGPLSSMHVDSSSNIIGSSPGFVSPTLTADVTESALTADFSLLPGSPCINKGIDSAVVPGSTDYMGNVRIVGTVDIGACEYGASSAAAGPMMAIDTMFKKCCSVLTHYAPPVSAIKTVEKAAINVYPNPAVNTCFISTPTLSGTIQLQDAAGKVVAEKNVLQSLTSFDVHTLPRGVYTIVWNNGIQKAAHILMLE